MFISVSTSWITQSKLTSFQSPGCSTSATAKPDPDTKFSFGVIPVNVPVWSSNEVIAVSPSVLSSTVSSPCVSVKSKSPPYAPESLLILMNASALLRKEHSVSVPSRMVIFSIPIRSPLTNNGVPVSVTSVGIPNSSLSLIMRQKTSSRT